MKDAWQDVLDRFVYGIYLITIKIDKDYNGMIASWVTQCSHNPPLILCAIRKGRLSHKQILTSDSLCINLLPKETGPIIRKFKIPEWRKKFNGTKYFHTTGGARVMKDAIAYLDCSLQKAVDTGGDHTLFIARIVDGKFINSGHVLSSEDYESTYRGNT